MLFGRNYQIENKQSLLQHHFLNKQSTFQNKMAYKMFGFFSIALILLAAVVNSSPSPKTGVRYTGDLKINGTIIGVQSAGLRGAADDQLCCCNIPGCNHLCGCACGSPCYANSQLCWC